MAGRALIGIAVIIFVAVVVLIIGIQLRSATPSHTSTTVILTTVSVSASTTIQSTTSFTTTINQSKNSSSYLGYTPFNSTIPKSDPFNDPNGPYYHKVYMTQSADGLQWSAGTLLFNYSSVPGAVLVNNSILVYYVDGTAMSPSGLIVARSTDFGKSWVRYALIFNQPEPKACSPADPDPVLLANGSVRLFITCFTSTAASYIGTAISKDGISFTLDKGERIATPAGTQDTYTDPDVMNADGQWALYVSLGMDDIAYNSTNGVNFTLVKTVSTSGAVSGSIALQNGTIRHYFCGNGGITSAVSSNPSASWNVEPGIRIATGSNKIVCDPSIIRLQNGTYVMFYKAQP